MEKPLQVFCCYARKDQSYLHELKKHLMALQRENLIDIKADIDITPGKEWEREITHHLEEAQILLLLISANFIASDYCYEKEMRQALARHDRGTACVVPVIIRPSTWKSTPLGKLQVLPKDAKPVSRWLNRDEAYISIVEGIRKVVSEFTTIFTSALPSDTPVDSYEQQAALPPQTLLQSILLPNSVLTTTQQSEPGKGHLQPSSDPGGVPRVTSPPPVPKNMPGKGRLVPSLKGRQRIAWSVFTLLLAISILSSLIFFLPPILPASSATVRITPISYHIVRSYQIEGVTGIPDFSQSQVKARVLTYHRSREAVTVPATAVQEATTATGTLTFSHSDNTIMLHAGDTLLDNTGIAFILDDDVTVEVNGSATGHVHASTPGANGNIAAYDFNASYLVTDAATQKYLATLYVENTSAFTGGQNLRSTVQQQDIDRAVRQLEAQVQRDVKAAIKAQMQPSEQLLDDLRCPDAELTSNHQAGATANEVTVTASITCQEDVYDSTSTRQIVSDLLTRDAITQFGDSYSLVGMIVIAHPTILARSLFSVAATFSIQMSVQAEGIWARQFSLTQKQGLIQVIAGKNRTDATALLLKQPGIRQVSIGTSGGWGSALPMSAKGISLVVVPVPGLQASPTSESS